MSVVSAKENQFLGLMTLTRPRSVSERAAVVRNAVLLVPAMVMPSRATIVPLFLKYSSGRWLHCPRLSLGLEVSLVLVALRRLIAFTTMTKSRKENVRGQTLTQRKLNRLV